MWGFKIKPVKSQSNLPSNLKKTILSCQLLNMHHWAKECGGPTLVTCACAWIAVSIRIIGYSLCERGAARRREQLL